jgi:hypothetical protein
MLLLKGSTPNFFSYIVAQITFKGPGFLQKAKEVLERRLGEENDGFALPLAYKQDEISNAHPT